MRDQPSDEPTYYDRPLLKAPHWEWNVVTYLFLGGIAGGLGILALVAREDRAPERRMRRTARGAALVLAAASPALLVSHLGRPERFLHMLRIVKFRSPMSLGVWGLLAYSLVAAANVTRELAEIGVLPGRLRRYVPASFTPLHALLGAFLAGYTGVLLSATANPLWASGKRHIPAACVASGTGGACALTVLLCLAQKNREPVRKLARVASVAGAAELVILLDFRRHAGAYGKPIFAGRRGARLRNGTMLAGTLAPLLLDALGSVFALPEPLETLCSASAAVLTLVGGYLFRETLIEAGKESARDPRAAFRQPT